MQMETGAPLLVAGLRPDEMDTASRRVDSGGHEGRGAGLTGLQPVQPVRHQDIKIIHRQGANDQKITPTRQAASASRSDSAVSIREQGREGKVIFFFMIRSRISA